MRTLEDRIAETLQNEAARLPEFDEARTHLVEPGEARRSRRWSPGWAVVAFVIALLAFAPLGFLGDLDSSGDLAGTSEPTTPTSFVPVPQVTVNEVEPPLLAEEVLDQESVLVALATTGETYDPLPSRIQGAAVKEGRVVIAGGELEVSEGRVVIPGGDLETSGVIWSSNGGAWIQASIEFPSNIHLGGQVGDHLLVDGITDVIATSDGFLAWTSFNLVTAQPIGSEGSLESAGTLLFTSSDGAIWMATHLPGQVAEVVEWQAGYLAIVAETDPINPASKALWSNDLNTWTEIADFDDGLAYLTTVVDDAVVVGVHYWKTEFDPDGTAYVVQGSETDRWFEIAPTTPPSG